MNKFEVKCEFNQTKESHRECGPTQSPLEPKGFISKFRVVTQTNKFDHKCVVTQTNKFNDKCAAIETNNFHAKYMTAQTSKRMRIVWPSKWASSKRNVRLRKPINSTGNV